jgi:hypothetical protein
MPENFRKGMKKQAGFSNRIACAEPSFFPISTEYNFNPNRG